MLPGFPGLGARKEEVVAPPLKETLLSALPGLSASNRAENNFSHPLCRELANDMKRYRILEETDSSLSPTLSRACEGRSVYLITFIFESLNVRQLSVCSEHRVECVKLTPISRVQRLDELHFIRSKKREIAYDFTRSSREARHASLTPTPSRACEAKIWRRQKIWARNDKSPWGRLFSQRLTTMHPLGALGVKL